MLDNWLSPVLFHEDDSIQKLSKEHFGRNIAIYINDFPVLERIDVAIIGVSKIEADKARKSLYSLDYPFHAIRIADLGNIRNEDPSFIIPLIKELLQSNIFPILIGRNASSSYAQFQAYNSLKQSTNLVCIDERIRYDYASTDADQYYLNNIINAENSNLFNLGVIGSQSHFTSEALLKMMNNRNFDHIRLGKLKGEAEDVEPFIRDADILFFNLNALKQSEAPGIESPSPSGLLSEEACKLSRYAGISDKLTSIGFYGFYSENDRCNQTSQVLAQLIWYFLDGFYHRIGDYPASMDGLVEYIVEFKNLEKPVTFWKSKKSGRWWMQIPVKTKKKHQRHKLIPCSYNDYQLACKDSIPDRLVNAYKRFS
ncbi:MAG: formiminoglutamase [Saprospiraceae bacterium]|jgi:formiminoglutamase